MPKQVTNVASDDALTTIYRLSHDEGEEVIAARVAERLGIKPASVAGMLTRLSRGRLPDAPHTQLRAADGRLFYEHCITRQGFDGPYTIAYHERRPHEHRAAPAAHGFALPVAAPPRPLAKRHYRS